MRTSYNMSAPTIAPAELTWKAVITGLLLALVFGASNAWLGMRAGQTVAATYPAAVIALALFRLPSFRGTIQEQNIVRTAAAVGEALIAGAIYTLPAFFLAEVDGQRIWTDLRSHYWEATFILLAGGLLGVLFTVYLRRALCEDAGLPWPEAVAGAEILKAGAANTNAPKYVFGALAFGAAIQFLKSDKGIRVFREYLEGFIPFRESLVRHFNFDKAPIGDVLHRGGIPWATPALSPALIGIGYIIGPRYASINVAGGVLAWWVLIPLLLFFDPDLPRRLGGGENAAPDVSAYTIWYNIVRPIAVGAMLVATVNTLAGMRSSLVQSVKGALAASKTGGKVATDRTHQDLPWARTAAGLGLIVILIAWLYQHFTGSWGVSLVATVAMTLTAFLLTAVGGYLVGLVGSSNQPLSGLTLGALVLSALLLLSVGAKGLAGVAAVLGVASVVACAVSVSGSMFQDLRAGALLQGTPWKMQLVVIIAVILLSFVLLWPILVLHEANLATGGIGGRALPAPQAGLMAQLAKGIVGGQMTWGLLAIGVGFGLALVLCGARAPMLIAVGMYLPFDTSAAIFLGGVFRWLAHKWGTDEEKGILVASGMVAGEAIVGILLAITFVAGVPSFTRAVFGVDELGVFRTAGSWLSLLAFGSIAWVLIRIPRKTRYP